MYQTISVLFLRRHRERPGFEAKSFTDVLDYSRLHGMYVAQSTSHPTDFLVGLMAPFVSATTPTPRESNEIIFRRPVQD